MKKNLWFLLCLTIAVVFNACSDDDDIVITPTTIQLECEEEGLDFSTFQVTVTELRSATEFKAVADAKGKAVLNLPLGQYDIVAENIVKGVVTYYGSANNFTLTEDNKLIKLEVKSIMDVLEKTFVLDELFFNCSDNGEFDRNMYEEYFTITNVSDRPLFADGLTFAICGDYNGVENAGDKSVYLQDSVVVSQAYSIPGDGSTYLVEPGKSLVIAHSAIDHSEGGKKAKARDLSGADFEIYVPYEYSMTVDNPDVPNLVVDYSMFQAFQWGYAGYAPMMLLRPEAKMADYVNKHLVNMDVTNSFGGMKQNYLIIPTNWIIDGAETGAKDYFYHKVLPDVVDRGRILLDEDEMMMGGFKSLFVKRKAAATGYLQDTNNSTVDFEVIPNGQKNYPL